MQDIERNLFDFENRREKGTADSVLETERKSDSARNQGRSEQNYRIDSKEDDELIAKLKAMIDSPIAEVVIDDDIRNLDDSEELVKRLRAMIESENMAKQGQGTEIKLSRKSANRNHGKVYTKSDARKVLSDVLREQLVFGNEQAYGALYGKHYTEVVDKLWHVLNDTEPGEREQRRQDISKKINSFLFLLFVAFSLEETNSATKQHPFYQIHPSNTEG